MINRNFERFIGIPWVLNGHSFAGADCLGLVRLAYRELRGVEIKHLSEIGAYEAAIVASRYATAKELVLGDGIFVAADGYLEDLDILELRPAAGSRFPLHAGVMLGGQVLHSTERVGSHLDPLSLFHTRILGAYRQCD